MPGMSERLAQQFEDFARGAISADAFEQALLTLCKTTPDSTWNVLALLDQFHRRRKVSAQLYQSLRHRIQRHALGIEELPDDRRPIHTRARESVLPPAPVLPFRHLLAEAPDPNPVSTLQPAYPQAPRAWRPRRGRAHALVLAAMVFGVGASPSVVTELPTKVDIQKQAAPGPAPQAERDPELEAISLSSDKYVVYPNGKMAEISVQRGEQADGAASFVWWTEAAGAKPDEDFVSGPRRMTQMPDGVASVKLLVPILANPERRHIEMFYVVIGKPGGGPHLGPVRRAAVFIMPQA